MTTPAVPEATAGTQPGGAVLHLDLPVRYFTVDGMWGYAIDSPVLIGGCLPTRAAAEEGALQALARSLLSRPDTRGRVEPDGAEPGVIRVTFAARAPEPARVDGPPASAPPALPEGAPHRIGDVMSRAVIGVDAATPRDEIAAALRRFGVSAVPVIDEEHRPVGIVSEADLVAFWTESTAPAGTRRVADRDAVAADLMTAPAVTVSAGAPLAEAARLMSERHVRRLVAVDDRGRVAGVVSRRDLLVP